MAETHSVLQGIVEISDAGAVCIQRCVSPTVSIAAVGPVDCAAMYADSYHITTGTSTQGDTSANGAEGGDHSLNDDELGQREGSVTLGSSVLCTHASIRCAPLQLQFVCLAPGLQGRWTY